jgi:hypothetical protein
MGKTSSQNTYSLLQAALRWCPPAPDLYNTLFCLLPSLWANLGKVGDPTHIPRLEDTSSDHRHLESTHCGSNLL